MEAGEIPMWHEPGAAAGHFCLFTKKDEGIYKNSEIRIERYILK